MTRIAWPLLMRLGLSELRLPPDTFWALTPVELMLLTGQGSSQAPLTRSGFRDLSSRFPDAGVRTQMEMDLE
jgi:uncharacterized phage protein (TIGR02216 family)